MLCSGSASSISRGGRVIPQHEISALPVEWNILPHTGQTYKEEREMFAERFVFIIFSPENSSGTEICKAFANGSISVMSGRPLPVSLS